MATALIDQEQQPTLKAASMKSHESPRSEGRNSKGNKNSARQRQIKKANKVLIRKLKGK